MAAAIDCFGPFRLDRDGRQLFLLDRPILLPDRHLDVLLALTRRPGIVLSKNKLIEDAWRGAAVQDDSLYLAIRDLRDRLGTMPDGRPHIETLNRRGFRFAAPVERVERVERVEQAPEAPPPASAVTAPDRILTTIAASPLAPPPLPLEGATALIQRLLAPHVVSLDGRLALESLTVSEAARMRDAYQRAVDADWSRTTAHIGLSRACLMLYEATRADDPPDLASLAIAVEHAQIACVQDRDAADAWGALSHALHRKKKYQPPANPDEASLDVAAALHAVSLQPTEWRHHLQLAFVSGGAQRKRAAEDVRATHPGLLLASWFIATVHVARVALPAARDETQAACLELSAQLRLPGGFAAIGLYLLHGLVLGAFNDLDEAHAALDQEIASAPADHLFGREARANSYYAHGAFYLRAGQPSRAIEALESALAVMPTHYLAMAVLAAITGRMPGALLARIESGQLAIGPTETALVQAVILCLQDRHADAADVCERALLQQRNGPGALWLLAVEPMINVAARPEIWARVIALLQRLSA